MVGYDGGSKMSNAIDDAILLRAGREAPRGASMGVIVDDLAAEGHAAEQVERAVWRLLGARRLTPSGFVCRVVRRRTDSGEIRQVRTYEFLLIPWSPEMDRQLDSRIESRS
jgi:hypothetical protein